jgi:RNA polymerase sigma factor (sigma-70 family)
MPWWATITPAELADLRRRVVQSISKRFAPTLGAEVEDVVQHAFAALLRNRAVIASDNDGLYRYLVVAARRAALDRIKTDRLRAERRPRAASPTDPGGSPLFQVLLREKKTTIRRIFDELEELDRLIVWSHVVDGESVQAIARRLGIGWHRVNATIQRVLVELRQVLLD